MKKIYNYILLSVLAIASAGCINEELTPDQPSAEAGDEVKFGLSLGDPKTRTIYGEETTIKVDQADGTSITKTVFPIYWVNGDKVQVFSPQCLEGRRSAEYKVVLPSGVTNPYYAEDLTPTGANGVQWGGNATADFYSLYPSGSYTLSSDEKKAENITINYTQNIDVNGTSVKSDMEDCLMYARTTGVKSGETVNLHYDPISTVVMLTLKVAANETGTAADSFTIQTITLTAPEGTYIAGTFSLNISNGTFVGFTEGKASNTITTQIVNSATGGYHTLSNGQSVTVPLFLAPAAYESVNGWKVQVVANGNIYTKTLNINKALEPGQIHKITLPELKPATTDWDVSKWMTYIPRNVYLSEVSIPGTWNSLNVDCQSETNIAEQYKLGVRAFHLDTRWRVDNTPGVNVGSNPSFTGIWGDDPDITELSVATGGSNTTYKCDGGNLMRKKSALTFSEYLAQVTGEVKDDEYMVVFCTFAQNNYNGDRCPSTWYKAISDACDANDKVYNASNLTANTLVGDVLNKVIVVVNLDVNVYSATLPESSKCLFTYVPMNLLSDHYTNATAAGHVDALYYSTKASADISMYTSHAQISTTGTSSVDCGDRGYSHPLTNRDALVNSIWDWSKNNTGLSNYSHDKWIYLGLGGYILTSSSGNGSGYDTIENRYASMIYNRIDEMGSNNIPFYPLGIILMNNKHGGNYTDSNGNDLEYSFDDVCKEVLMLNNKYRMQFDSNKPSDYVAPVMTAAASYSSGMQDTGTSAFGWE